MSPSRRVLIIGGVAGGMSTATRLRRRDEQAEITVIERSGYVSYANCGLPYHIGGVIPERDSLLLQTADSLHERFNITVHTGTEATAINTDKKQVTVRNLNTGTENTLPYDQLVLSLGASPIHLPIPGIDRALTLRSVEDTDAIIASLTDLPENASAVILGGGFIGVEIAENLVHRGLTVSIVERGDHILGTLDPEMAAIIHKELLKNGVHIFSRSEATEIGEKEVLISSTTDGKTQALAADIVISAVGVKADTAFVQAAGIECTESGAILVNEKLETSAPGVYALGDSIVSRDAFSSEPVIVPLAQTANRRGRLLADIIVGDDRTDGGVYATAILGIFGLSVASTGWTEKKAHQAGIDYDVINIHPLNHAGYYPGSAPLTMKVIVSEDKILGAQIIGKEGVDKRIDVLATAMQSGRSASSLMDLELAYAPQFGSAKDPINMVGYVADNIRTGFSKQVRWNQLEKGNYTIIDVRTPQEYERGAIPGSINIPVDELRARFDELPEGPLVVHCQVGQRSHVAESILRGLGRTDVYNLSGGYKTWRNGTSL